MRYAIDVIDTDGRCRTLVVELVGGTESAILVDMNEHRLSIELSKIAGWYPIDEPLTSELSIRKWLPDHMQFVPCF